MLLRLDGRGTLVTQLTRAVRAEIPSGSLRGGQRLPPTRTLSEEFGLSHRDGIAALARVLDRMS